MQNLIDTKFLEEELSKATYNSNLGVKTIELNKTRVAGVSVSAILIQIDPGKELSPHLHETGGGEIWLPLSKGTLQLGKAKRMGSGDPILNSEGKIMTDWKEPVELTPFKAVEVPVGVPHYLFASGNEPLLIVCFLPSNHPGPDIKYTTHPNK